jgi:AcrR family transcriptional regulator
MSRPPNPELPQRIVATAEAIVADDGYERLNMRRLAERVGITPTTLYYYFESKEHILAALNLVAAEKLNAKISAIDTTDARAAIIALGRAYIDFAIENPGLYKLFMEVSIDSSLMDEDHRHVLHHAYYAAQRGFAQMAEQGHYDNDPLKGAMMGWIQLHGFASLLVTGTLERVLGLDPDQLRDIFLEMTTDTLMQRG